MRTFHITGLCSKPTDEIMNFVRLAAVSSGEYGSFKTSLVINDEPSRLKCDELQS